MTARAESRSGRWRSLGVATAAVCAFGVACGGSSGVHKAVPAPSPAPASASPAPEPVNPAVVRNQVVAATTQVPSYAFVTTETLQGGKARDVTTITGRAVRPSSVTYTVSSAHGRTSVVTIGMHSWVKKGTAAWRTGRSPHKGDDPASVLVSLLRAGTVQQADATHLTLLLPARTAFRIHFVNVVPDKPVMLSFVLDDQHHVVSLTAVIEVHARARHLTLTTVTTYSGFGAQPPVTAPR